LTAARVSGGKDECQVRLTGIERKYWIGTEISRLAGYGFRGTVTAGDGSNPKGGKMGAGYPKKDFEHIELPTKLLDYFLRSNKATRLFLTKYEKQHQSI